MTSPLAAALPKGISEESFRSAVSASGYPLQINVAAVLKKREFFLQEEFAFEDPDAGGRRTLDVVGTHRCPKYESEGGQSEFVITALIECKQSQHPVVLFESVSPPMLHRFPQLIGYPGQEMKVADEKPSGVIHLVPIMEFLGSLQEGFVSNPSVAASLSRAVPNGKKVSLSGEDVYRGITMPLVKAAHALRQYWSKSRRDSSEPLILRPVFPIAVVDCPLIFVGQPTDEPTIEPRPWMRLAVRDPMSGRRDPWKPLGVEIIDVVQWGFFAEYLDEHLLPFVRAIRERACEIHDDFLRGEVTIVGLDWSAPRDQPLYQLLREDK